MSKNQIQCSSNHQPKLSTSKTHGVLTNKCMAKKINYKLDSKFITIIIKELNK